MAPGDGGLFTCRNPECGARGDIFSFYQRRHGCDFPTAVRALAEFAGAPVTAPPPVRSEPHVDFDTLTAAFHEALLASPDRLAYLTGHRGLTLETIRQYEIGHNGTRYTIPIRDEFGEVVNLRQYDPHANGPDKMMSWRTGYGAARLWPIAAVLDNPGAPILIVEGEWDALLARQSGFNAVTCSGGAGKWRDAWRPLFEGREVWVCYDCDPAGRTGARQVAEAIA